MASESFSEEISEQTTENSESVSEESRAEESSDSSSEAPKRHELAVSTLVHLMGLPTATELDAIETKIDVVASKLTRLAGQFDRMETQMNKFANDLYLDRIDFQLSDIRNVIKKVFAEAMTSNQIGFETEAAAPSEENSAAGAKHSLSSVPDEEDN